MLPAAYGAAVTRSRSFLLGLLPSHAQTSSHDVRSKFTICLPLRLVITFSNIRLATVQASLRVCQYSY